MSENSTILHTNLAFINTIHYFMFLFTCLALKSVFLLPTATPCHCSLKIFKEKILSKECAYPQLLCISYVFINQSLKSDK